jgi:transposase
LSDLLGAHVSAATLSSIVAANAERLEPFLEVVRQQIATAPVAHFDETGLRVAAQGAWVHSASTDKLSLFTAHASRGHDAITAAGVLPDFTGIAVHDGYTPYRRYGAAHALCNAHHLRELAGILDADPDQDWAGQMIRLLCEINDTTRYARATGADALDDRLLAAYRSRYEQIITAGKAANPTPAGARSRSPAARLLARLGGFAADVLRFAYDLRVPFDNSQAERDIRMVKLRQKISGGLRTMTGTQIFCAIRSYPSTARKHGLGALDALTQLHNGQAWLPQTGSTPPSGDGAS